MRFPIISKDTRYGSEVTNGTETSPGSDSAAAAVDQTLVAKTGSDSGMVAPIKIDQSCLPSPAGAPTDEVKSVESKDVGSQKLTTSDTDSWHSTALIEDQTHATLTKISEKTGLNIRVKDGCKSQIISATGVNEWVDIADYVQDGPAFDSQVDDPDSDRENKPSAEKRKKKSAKKGRQSEKTPNPEPPKAQRKPGKSAKTISSQSSEQSGGSKASRQINDSIKQQEKSYRFTERYLDMLKKMDRTDIVQVRNFNNWYNKNRREIDDTKIFVCLTCDRTTGHMCFCAINNPPEAAETESTDEAVTVNAPNGQIHSYGFIGSLEYGKNEIIGQQIVVDRPLNEHTPWLVFGKNIDITRLDENMLNYIRTHQHTTYKYNGVDDRAMKLEHSKRLAMSYLETVGVKTHLMNTAQVNCMMMTVQKACDDRTSSVLYSNSAPNFRLAFQICGGAAVLVAGYFTYRHISRKAGPLVESVTQMCGAYLVRGTYGLAKVALLLAKSIWRESIRYGSMLALKCQNMHILNKLPSNLSPTVIATQLTAKSLTLPDKFPDVQALVTDLALVTMLTDSTG